MALRTIFLLITFFLLGNYSIGQINRNKIKILTEKYNKYIKADSIDHDHYGTIYDEIFEYSYPNVQTSDKNLNKFINDTIRKIIEIDHYKSVPKRKWGWKNIEDKPAENYVSYKVHFISPYFISITIHKDGYAGGGGNGSRHDITALTFDLVNKKILTTANIFNRLTYPAAYKIFRQQFDSLANDEFLSHTKLDSLDSLSWVSNSTFALFLNKVVLYTDVSYGHGYFSEEIVYEYAKYPEIFDKKFIATVMKK